MRRLLLVLLPLLATAQVTTIPTGQSGHQAITQKNAIVISASSGTVTIDPNFLYADLDTATLGVGVQSPSGSKRMVVDTTGNRSAWFRAGSATLNADLELGIKTDADESLVEFYTDDTGGLYSDLFTVRMNRDTMDFRWERTDSGDPDLDAMSVQSVNGGDTYLFLKGDTGTLAGIGLCQNKGESGCEGIVHSATGDLTFGYVGGDSQLVLSDTNVAVGNAHTPSSADLSVMDEVAGNSTTFTVQLGDTQGSDNPIDVLSNAGVSLGGFNASGQLFLVGATTDALPLFNASDALVESGILWKATGECTGSNGGALTINSSDEVVCSDDDGGTGGAADNIQVNASSVTDANFNDSSPAAVGTGKNVLWQQTGSGPTAISAYMPEMVGDSGSGGTAGLVPEPAAGDATKCLYGDGTWSACGTGGGAPGGSGSELQYRAGASTFGAVSGTSVSGSDITMTGKFDLGGGTAEVPNSTTLPGTCVAGELYMDTDATSGQQLYGCEGGAWVLQGDGTVTGGTGDAPLDGPYITYAADPDLTAELIIEGGDGITVTQSSPNLRLDLDSSYAVTQSGNNNMVGNNKVGLGGDWLSETYTNDGTTGTTLYKVAKLSGGEVVLAGTSDTTFLGVCADGCGTSGSARVATRGQVDCIFDTNTTQDDWVRLSTSNAGQCSDTGSSTEPTSGTIVGRVLSTNGTPGTYKISLSPRMGAAAAGGGGGGGSTNHMVAVVFDGGGSVIAAGSEVWVPVAVGGTITKAELTANAIGSAVVDIWKDTFANFPPTDSDSITSATPVTISSARTVQDTSLTGWSKVLSAGEWLLFHVDSASTVTKFTVALYYTE